MPLLFQQWNKNTHVWLFTFFCSLHKQCTFLYISTCARGREHKWAISFIQQCIATRCFIPWMNQVLNIQYWVSQRFSGPFRRSHLFRFYWISRFERIVWSEWFRHLLKQGLAATYWRFYCIFIYPKNQLRCTFSKILFNYQYWPNFFYFRPQKKKEKLRQIFH